MKTKKILFAALFSLAALVLVTNINVISSWALSITAGGTNDNLYLNPSGNGRVVVGGDSIVVASRSSDPTTNRVGQLYFNTQTQTLRVYNGTEWKSLAYEQSNFSIDLEKDSTQYLSISDGSQTGLKFSGSFSLAMWVKFESLPTSGNAHALAGKMDAGVGSNFGYIWFFQNNSGTYRFLTYLSPSSGNASAYTGNWTPSTGTWYHVAVTWDSSSSTLRYYVDGTQLGSDITTTESSLYTGGTAPFTVGMNGDGSSNAFDGLIDEVWAFNRSLSSTEIANSYQGELNGNESGLVGYWQFNDDLADKTSSGNNLTNNGSAQFSTDAPF